MCLTGCSESSKPSSSPGGNSATDSTSESAECPPPKIKSGGLSGLTLDVTYEVEGPECDSVQVIQVFWGTRRTDSLKVGSQEREIGGKKYDAFVDGGKNSPFVTLGGNPPAHATKPFYLTADEVKSQVNFSGGKGTVRIYDRPGAVAAHDEAFFETAIMCTNYKKSGKDKVLKAFKWGWVNKGTKYQSSMGSGAKSSGLEESDDVSSEFKAVVAGDYPGFEFY